MARPNPMIPSLEKRKIPTAATRFLTVTLGTETYAISALNVREIIRPLDISPVPRTAPHLLGVINLRGKIVPVIDLRMKFGLPFTGRTERTCIVVAQTGESPRDLQLTGLMVDEAREVITLTDIEDAPSFGTTIDTSCIRGIARVKDSVVILLDLPRALGQPKPQA